ncbi:NUDIX domain-containing protein [Devosia soli]|uniref:NUDIX domain-containing protein n=1 Tax=Devosia soli TaxID=361041 RepID=UPI000A907954|nr:NUDIX domain-containing protein [Devosia soli]
MGEKVCAVPFRQTSQGMEVLSFLHPVAGRQFVKGTLEPNELPAVAAARELREESGLSLAASPVLLGDAMIGSPPVRWHFYAFNTDGLPQSWSHWTEDDGGHMFLFFWHLLEKDLDREWHPIFHQAYRIIRFGLRDIAGPVPQGAASKAGARRVSDKQFSIGRSPTFSAPSRRD